LDRFGLNFGTFNSAAAAEPWRLGVLPAITVARKSPRRKKNGLEGTLMEAAAQGRHGVRGLRRPETILGIFMSLVGN